MEPGFGSASLHLGQSEQEVEAVLGHRQSLTRKFAGQYFYNYPKLGLEIDFGQRGGNAKYLYFFRSGFRGNTSTEMFTTGNIRPGDSRSKVLDVFGKPQRESEAVPFMNRSIDAWSHYDIGINFQFGPDDYINMITISCPETRLLLLLN